MTGRPSSSNVSTGERIRQARKRRGWTQAELAREALIALRLVGKAEKDDPTTTATTLRAIAAVLPEAGIKVEPPVKRSAADEPDHVRISEEIRRRVGVDAAIKYLQNVIREQAEAQENAAIQRARDALSQEDKRQ